jgi:glycosyltransferase involved in cell wall biosynthesis
MPYKNVETLIRGVGLLTHFELHLLSKITPARKHQLEALAKTLNANVVFHEGVTDHEYQELLKDSFALVSASKDEGFGIPLVEAMQQGTPVLVSDMDIFHEVAGSAGTFFAGENPEDFATQALSLESPKVWNDLSKQSLEQAKQFSWESSADALIELFSEI